MTFQTREELAEYVKAAPAVDKEAEKRRKHREYMRKWMAKQDPDYSKKAQRRHYLRKAEKIMRGEE
jgi:hypothetical protein